MLCNRRIPIQDRIRLFSASISPCVLYACGTWTMTAESERQLRSAQRRMFRWIVRVPRAPDEDWVAYIKRATHSSESLSRQHGAQDWVTMQRNRKWKFAGFVASRSDSRWSQRILDWRPWFRTHCHRNVGHPLKRWDDTIVAVAGGSWAEAARNSDLWSALAHAYTQDTS